MAPMFLKSAVVATEWGAMFTRVQRLIQTSKPQHAHAKPIQRHRSRKHAVSHWLLFPGKGVNMAPIFLKSAVVAIEWGAMFTRVQRLIQTRSMLTQNLSDAIVRVSMPFLVGYPFS